MSKVPEGRRSYDGAVEVNSTPNNSEELEIRIECYRSRIRKLEKKKDLLKPSETDSSR